MITVNTPERLRLEYGANWIELTRRENCTALNSNLTEGEPQGELNYSDGLIDGFEGFLLALYSQGIDLTTQEVQTAIEGYLDVMSNHI